MSKRTLFVVGLIAMLAISFGVVSAQDDLADVDPTGANIVYWHEWRGAAGEAMTALVEEFNSTNEWGITVEEVPLGGSGDVVDALNLGIVSGDLPNIGGATFVNDAMGYFLEGVLVPLDAYMEDATWGLSEEEAADLNLSLLNTGRAPGAPFDGQQLAWPIGMTGNVNSVNMTMLGELGFDAPPSTLAEFREVSCAAAELTTADGGDVQGFPIRDDGFDLYSFLAANGAEFFNAETGYDFTVPESIEVMTFFQDLYNDGCAYVPEGSFDNTADFSLGLNPMAVGSTAGIPFIQRPMDENGIDVEWINTTVPHAEGNRIVQLFFRGAGIFESTPEENLASWLFFKFLASESAQLAWTQAANYYTYSLSAAANLDPDFLAANPQYNNLNEILQDPDVRVYNAPAHVGLSDIAFGPVSELVANIYRWRAGCHGSGAGPERRSQRNL